MASEHAPARGLYLSGVTSAAVPSSLAYDGQAYRIEIEGTVVGTFPAGEVRVSERIGNIPRTFAFPDGARFETHENDLVDAWFGGRARGSLASRLESSARLAALSGAFLVGFLLLLYFVAVPLGADWIARRLPDRVSEEISRQVMGWLKDRARYDQILLPSGEEAKVARAYTRTAKAVPQLRLRFHTVNMGGMFANAFALPDGTVIVTDNLVPLLTEDELLAVLLHEAGHVEAKHGLSLLVETSVISVLVFAIAGGDGTAIPLLFLHSSYSRRHESAADAYAKRRLRELGISPKLLGSALDKLVKANGMTEDKQLSFLSSHPLTEERKRELARD